MKLTVIGPTHPFRGGIAHYTTLLVRALRQQHAVQFVSYCRQYPCWLYPGGSDLDPSTHLLIEEKPDERIDAFNPFEWRGLAAKVQAHQSSLVILPWTVAYWAPFYFIFLRRLRRAARAPKVLFLCHNVIEHEPAWWKSWLAKRILSQGDFFVVHSRYDREKLRTWLPAIAENNIMVASHPAYRHLGQSLPEKQSARAQLGLQAEKVLLFFGAIRPYKGLHYLLQSLPEILSHWPVHLLIAGELWGEAKQYLREIDRLGIRRQVTLFSRYVPNEEVSLYFAAADLVVAPYASATQSGIVQLAYGFGKPVVATRVGGIPEVVEDGQTGYLVPPCDAAAISRAVIDYYSGGRELEMTRNIQAAASFSGWEELAAAIGKMALAALENSQ